MAEEAELEGAEDDFATEDACIRGAACNRKRGLSCPDNCIWMQYAGERHPRCFGFHRGRGIVPPDSQEGALVVKTCGICPAEMDCLVETCNRFGDDPEAFDAALEALC